MKIREMHKELSRIEKNKAENNLLNEKYEQSLSCNEQISTKNQNNSLITTQNTVINACELIDKQAENRRIIGGKQADNRRTIGGKQAEKNEIGGKQADKQADKQTGEQAENRRKTGGKQAEIYTFSDLSGLQREFIQIIFDNLRNDRAMYTGRLSLQNISEIVSISTRSAKDVIYELTKKQILTRYKSRCGRSGWAQYSLAQHIYDEMTKLEIDGKLAENRRKTGGKQADKQTDKQTDGGPCSSSILYNNITTTDEWSTVEIPTALKPLNFGTSIITQAKKMDIPLEKFKESLDAFAFDVTENKLLEKKNIRSAIGYFINALKEAECYIPPQNYKSVKDQALEEMLKRREGRAKEIKEKQNRFMQAEFEIWVNELPEEEKRNPQFYIPGSTLMGDTHKASLKAYFTQNIWPEIWANIQRDLLFNSEKQSAQPQ